MRNAPALVRAVIGLLAGVFVGALGSLTHRSIPPWGLVLGVVATVLLSIWLRSSGDWAALGGGILGWFVTVQILSMAGPGGDLLILGDGLGYGWFIAGTIATLAGGFLPRRFLAESSQ